MSNKLANCKACGQEIAANAKACPHCGAKNKKPIFKKWWFWAIIVVILIAVVSGGGEESPSSDPSKVGTVAQNDQAGTTAGNSATTTTPAKTVYQVGDIIESSNLVISYLSCEEYVSDNMFVQPKDGYRFISCEFEFENVGSSDEFVSSANFDCYADGFSCDATYIRDDNLSATLSAGRKVKGTVTFEVPIDAVVVELEYLSNYWTSNRVVFAVQ